MIKNEIVTKIETFTEIVKNFFHSDPNLYDIDITIAKLEALRGLYGEANYQNADVDEVTQTIEMARETKNIIEHLKKKQNETSDDDYEDDEDELPRHYLGQEGELIFENNCAVLVFH